MEDVECDHSKKDGDPIEEDYCDAGTKHKSGYGTYVKSVPKSVSLEMILGRS